MLASLNIAAGTRTPLKRLGEDLELVASKSVETITEARKIEPDSKSQEKSAASHSLFAVVEQPRKLSGLVGSSNLRLGTVISDFQLPK